MKLLKPRFESELRRHAYNQRIIIDWNSLTGNIANSESLDFVNLKLGKNWSTERFKISTE